jgi:hypothetical protein
MRTAIAHSALTASLAPPLPPLNSICCATISYSKSLTSQKYRLTLCVYHSLKESQNYPHVAFLKGLNPGEFLLTLAMPPLSSLPCLSSGCYRPISLPPPPPFPPPPSPPAGCVLVQIQPRRKDSLQPSLVTPPSLKTGLCLLEKKYFH